MSVERAGVVCSSSHRGGTEASTECAMGSSVWDVESSSESLGMTISTDVSVGRRICPSSTGGSCSSRHSVDSACAT